MNLKLTHTTGDVEFVRVEDVEIGVDSGAGQLAYSLTLKQPEGWTDYIRAVKSVERVPDTPFRYFHMPNAGVWTDDLVPVCSFCKGKAEVCTVCKAGLCTEVTDSCPVDECTECGERDCPKRDELHYHHDGCPSCYKPDPTPLGDRVRRSLGELMSDHYRAELPPYEELQLKCKLLDEKCEQLKKQLDTEVYEHHLTAISTQRSWDEVDNLKNRIEMASRWLTGQGGGL